MYVLYIRFVRALYDVQYCKEHRPVVRVTPFWYDHTRIFITGYTTNSKKLDADFEHTVYEYIRLVLYLYVLYMQRHKEIQYCIYSMYHTV
jgi:hypothetical protein